MLGLPGVPRDARVVVVHRKSGRNIDGCALRSFGLPRNSNRSVRVRAYVAYEITLPRPRTGAQSKGMDSGFESLGLFPCGFLVSVRC